MKWERTFQFSAPVEKVWQAFTDRECEFRVMDDENAYQSRGAIKIEYTERTTNQSLAWTEIEGADRWDMVVTFSETDSGTSVTIVRSGFGEGDDWLKSAMGRLLGWEHVLADIEVYFRTGTRPRRFFTTPWMTLGLDVVADGGGVRVLGVIPGMLGERAGVQMGDVVICVAGMPVYGIAEYWLTERMVKERGGDVDFEVIRDGKLHTTPALAAAAL